MTVYWDGGGHYLEAGYSHEGDSVSLVVFGDPLGHGVEREYLVDEEGVALVSVMHFHGGEPDAVGLLAHGVGLGVPTIEITDEADLVGGGVIAVEIHCAR